MFVYGSKVAEFSPLKPFKNKEILINIEEVGKFFPFPFFCKVYQYQQLSQKPNRSENISKSYRLSNSKCSSLVSEDKWQDIFFFVIRKVPTKFQQNKK